MCIVGILAIGLPIVESGLFDHWSIGLLCLSNYKLIWYLLGNYLVIGLSANHKGIGSLGYYTWPIEVSTHWAIGLSGCWIIGLSNKLKLMAIGYRLLDYWTTGNGTWREYWQIGINYISSVRYWYWEYWSYGLDRSFGQGHWTKKLKKWNVCQIHKVYHLCTTAESKQSTLLERLAIIQLALCLTSNNDITHRFNLEIMTKHFHGFLRKLLI